MSLPALQAQVLAICLRRVKLALSRADHGIERRKEEAVSAIDCALRDLPTGTLSDSATLADMGLDSRACRVLSEAGLFTVADLRREGYAKLQRDHGYRLASRVKLSLSTFGVRLTRDGSAVSRNA